MSFHFAFGRTVLNNNDWNITVNNDGGNLTASTKYFSLQAQNAIGKNKLIVSNSISITNGASVTINILSSALKEGEGWTHFVIGVSNSNTETNFNQIARVPIYSHTDGNINLKLPRSFPLSITFTNDEQLATVIFLNNINNLPITNLVYGMRRAITALDNNIYEYNPHSTEEPNDLTVLEALTGNWIKKDTFSTYIANVNGAGGCARNLANVRDFSDIETIDYDADGNNSLPTRYYLYNSSGTTLQPYIGITPTIQINGVESTEIFSNKVFYKILGIANIATGELRTLNSTTNAPFDYLNSIQTYSAESPFTQVKDYIQQTEAILIEVYLNFLGLEFNNLLPTGYFQLNFGFTIPRGTYTATGSLFEKGIIFNKYNKSRLYPNFFNTVIVGEGSGVVKNFSWYNCSSTVFNLAENTPNQKLFINTAGVVFPDIAEKNDTLLRGIVDTTPKESILSQWSDYIAIGENKAVSILVNYDADEQLNLRVRNDYPDVIADDWAILNATSLNIYIQRQSDGQIRRFGNNLIAITNGLQEFLIDAWENGVIVAEEDLPNIPQSFFNPVDNDITQDIGIGDFTADNYRVAHSYYWDGTTVSDISHDPSVGCITEAFLSGETIFNKTIEEGITITVNSTSSFLFDSLILNQGLFLLPGQIYLFDVSHPNNANKILSFSSVKNGIHAGGTDYTNGINRIGTPGTEYAMVKFKIPLNAPVILYPYEPSINNFGNNSYFLTRATYSSQPEDPEIDFSNLGDWTPDNNDNNIDLGDWTPDNNDNNIDLGDWTT